MKNNYSYVGITFVILIFGIWGVNELGNRLKSRELVFFEKVPDFEFTNQDGKLISNKDYANRMGDRVDRAKTPLKKNWIKGAIKKPGQLRKDLGVKHLTKALVQEAFPGI